LTARSRGLSPCTESTRRLCATSALIPTYDSRLIGGGTKGPPRSPRSIPRLSSASAVTPGLDLECWASRRSSSGSRWTPIADLLRVPCDSERPSGVQAQARGDESDDHARTRLVLLPSAKSGRELNGGADDSVSSRAAVCRRALRALALVAKRSRFQGATASAPPAYVAERGVAQGGDTIGFGRCRYWRARWSTTGERQPSEPCAWAQVSESRRCP
jgi:hypothetical protein